MSRENKLLVLFIIIALIAPLFHILGIGDWIDNYYYIDYLKLEGYESNTELHQIFMGIMGTITALYGFYLFKKIKLFSEKLLIVFGIILNALLALYLPYYILVYTILYPISQSIG